MRTLVLVALLLTPFASAGTPEAPEITDAAGDCAFAPGNHYGDIVAAWISDETAESFMVNIQLAEFVEPLAGGIGYTIQFEHQGVQFGVVAAYMGPGLGWYYANGYVSGDEASDFNETEGSFTSPLISVLFLKSNFPHGDSADNQLVNFQGGSIDLKAQVPFFFVPAPLPAYPPALACDEVDGTIAYTFTVGQHAMHGASGNETGEPETIVDAGIEEAPAVTTPAESAAPARSVPGPGLAAALVALGALALLRRR